MPLIDMSLEKLREYQGTNPCPADFDKYWNDAILEMKATDPQLELVPADFTVPFAECFDLYFTGVGGSRIHAKYLRLKGLKEPHPAVIQFHGYIGKSGDWNDKLNF